MRLIDADKLVAVTLTDGGYWTKEVYYKADIDAAPTVYPLPNGPLTLEELREMEGEPVWISYVNSAKGKYHIVRAFGPNSIIFDEYDKEFGPYKSLFLGNCGKTWLAYRRRPEEGTA